MYAIIVNDLGLFGGVGLLCAYLVFVARGFKTAMVTHDGFVKLLACRPVRCVRAPGVRDRRRRYQGDPADRRTLPFVSAGGSSVLANFVLLALFLIASHAAPRDPLEQGGADVNNQITRLFTVIVAVRPARGFHLSVDRVRGRLRREPDDRWHPGQPTAAARAAAIPRGIIRAADGTRLAVN